MTNAVEIKTSVGIMECGFRNAKNEECRQPAIMQTLLQGIWTPICDFHYDLLLMKRQNKQQIEMQSLRNKNHKNQLTT